MIFLRLKFIVCLFIVAMLNIGMAHADTEERTFEYVSDWTNLSDGDQFIVVNEFYSVAMCDAMNGTGFTSCAVSINGGCITTNESVLLLTLERDGDYVYLKTQDGLYLSNNSASDTNNSVTLNEEKDETSRAKIENCDGFVKILFEKNVSKALLYSTNSIKRFSCYPSDNGGVLTRRIQLYRYEGARRSTSVSFANSQVTIYKGHEQDFEAQRANVVAYDGTSLDNAALKYSSSNADVAEVDASTGGVTLVGLGTAVISAQYDGDEAYRGSVGSYTLNYIKNETQTTFGKGIDNSTFRVVVGMESDFVAPKATLSPDGIGEVAYKSSDEGVASVDAFGNVAFGSSTGTAIITAYFDGNDDYNRSSASYTIKRVSNAVIWSSENCSFDNLPKTTEITKEKAFNFVGDDGIEYAFKVSGCCKTRNANGILKLFSGRGVVKSPQIDAPNGYRITVYHYKKSSSYVLLISSGSVSSNVVEKDADVVASATEGLGYKTTLDVPTSSSFTISSFNECYIGKIVIEINPVANVSLDESAVNKDVIAENKGSYVNVSLNRPFLGGEWNTICLPFSVDEATLKNVFGDGVQLRQFGSVDVDKAIMYFTEATSITSGEPYLIKPEEDVDGLMFNSVLIDDVVPAMRGENGYYMQGVYCPTSINEDGTNLFLGEANKFYKPITGQNTIYGFRVFFVVPESCVNKVVSYDAEGSVDAISEVGMKSSHIPSKVYAIDGRRVNMVAGSQLPSGIYIVDGKKVVVR